MRHQDAYGISSAFYASATANWSTCGCLSFQPDRARARSRRRSSNLRLAATPDPWGAPVSFVPVPAGRSYCAPLVRVGRVSVALFVAATALDATLVLLPRLVPDVAAFEIGVWHLLGWTLGMWAYSVVYRPAGGPRWAKDWPAAHPACSAQMLRDMASDDSPEPVRKVAAHRLCPSDVLASLSFHPDEGVRARVAANAACPISMLTLLAVDSSPQTRARVAANAACPVSMLTLLAVDSSPQIRAATVSHPRCPSSVALLLSVDIEARVRAAMASRPGVGAEILQLLARDVSAQVRARAETSLAGVRSPAAPRRGTFPAAGGWLSPNRQPCRFHQIRGRFPGAARSGHQRGVWRRLLGGARLRRR